MRSRLAPFVVAALTSVFGSSCPKVDAAAEVRAGRAAVDRALRAAKAVRDHDATPALAAVAPVREPAPPPPKPVVAAVAAPPPSAAPEPLAAAPPSEPDAPPDAPGRRPPRCQGCARAARGAERARGSRARGDGEGDVDLRGAALVREAHRLSARGRRGEARGLAEQSRVVRSRLVRDRATGLRLRRAVRDARPARRGRRRGQEAARSRDAPVHVRDERLAAADALRARPERRRGGARRARSRVAPARRRAPRGRGRLRRAARRGADARVARGGPQRAGAFEWSAPLARRARGRPRRGAIGVRAAVDVQKPTSARGASRPSSRSCRSIARASSRRAPSSASRSKARTPRCPSRS